MKQQKPRIEAIYPLSPMQEGMLFHTLYAPHSGVYVEQMVFAIASLDVPAFQQAWQRVVARHGVLRTLFVWEKRTKPLQVVRREVELPWREEDWRLNEEPKEALDAYLAAEREQGFELNKAPLMRFGLMRVTEEQYYFVWNFHHLLLDGWSIPLIWQEVERFYEAISRGAPIYLKRPRPYKDYITWLQRQDLRQAEGYWQQALRGFTAPTPLVVDRVSSHDEAMRPLADGGREGVYSQNSIYLSSTVADPLNQLARQNRVTFNTLVQGAWALLLSRYSGEQDVLFGATVSGRPPELRGVERMVGIFINTLPVRVKVPAEAELLPWLQQLQQEQLEREEYAYTPLVDIQGWSEVPSGMALFETLLVFENYPVSDQQAGGLDKTVLHSVEQTNYPLTVEAELSEEEGGAQLRLTMYYDTSRFDDATIRRMGGHFQTLLEGMAANPSQRIHDLPLLTAAERHQLLVEWNETAAPSPSYHALGVRPLPPSPPRLLPSPPRPLAPSLPRSERGLGVHQLFEQQVERSPDAIAVVCKGHNMSDVSLTYRELNARANQLAHHLQALGVGPGTLVGICVENSLEMIVGLLGILKAGGAYVPLSPTYPQQRLALMLESADLSILLTQQHLLESLPPTTAQLLCLDSDWSRIASQKQDNPSTGSGHRPMGQGNLVYVIFTSGSTGQPKCAAVYHHGFTNLVSWFVRQFGLNATDRVLVTSSFSFDLTQKNFFAPLLVGGQLHLSAAAPYQYEAMRRHISEHQITW